MALLIITALAAMALLVISTDQFVSGASTVANGLHLSSVLIGAVILGCGTGLPELALAFHRSHINPVSQLFGTTGSGGGGVILIAAVLALAVVLSIPTLLPNLIARHSPLILAATIAFAAILRGSLDIYEGAAMLFGFGVGMGAIIFAERTDDFDPFDPVIADDYEGHGVFIEAPVMTPVQFGATRCLIGLFGTAVGAQLLAWSAQHLLVDLGYGPVVTGLVFIGLGSVLPHVVVAVQALKQHHEALAIGNLIGSNLFQSLAIGGLVAVIRPYQEGGTFDLQLLGIVAATAALTWLLLHGADELTRREGTGLLFSYVALILLTVG